MKITGSHTVNRAELVALTTGPTGHATRLVARLASRVAATAKMRAPVDTGKLRQETNAQAMPQVQGSVVRSSVQSQVDYAMAVHEGMRPLVILPKNGQALRFTTSSGVVYATRVNHPGTKGRPFLRNALDAEGPRLGFTVGR